MIKAILPEEKEAAIEALDLTKLYLKLTDKVEGPGWTFKFCQRVTERYKKFLILMVRYPEKVIVPDKQVDTLWHAHILDTRKYYEDCIACFGEFLHHYPYFGLNGEEDKANLHAEYDETNRLMHNEFKQQDLQNWSNAECSVCASSCR